MAGDALANQRILLVEDEFFLADELARSLQAAGATIVGPAASIRNALNLIATAGHLDAAVLDLNLRGETAIPVADALLERNVPFVFATGYGHGFVPVRYRHVKRCEKPMNPAKIVRALFG